MRRLLQEKSRPNIRLPVFQRYPRRSRRLLFAKMVQSDGLVGHYSLLPDRQLNHIATRSFDFTGRPRALPGNVTALRIPEDIVKAHAHDHSAASASPSTTLPQRARHGSLTSRPTNGRKTLDVNLTAPFLLTQAVLPTIKAQNYGRIINISSSSRRMVSTLGRAA